MCRRPESSNIHHRLLFDLYITPMPNVLIQHKLVDMKKPSSKFHFQTFFWEIKRQFLWHKSIHCEKHMFLSSALTSHLNTLHASPSTSLENSRRLLLKYRAWSIRRHIFRVADHHNDENYIL